MQKILTISVAAYNVENCLAKCLDSLINTSVAGSLEIIVVNDGSKDHTQDIINTYSQQNPGIVIGINKKNGGHGSTINASIRAASGKYYKIVDADDWVDKKGIELLVEFLKTSECDLVLNPYYEVIGDEIKNTYIPYNNIDTDHIYKFDDQSECFEIPMHGMTLKTDIVKQIGPVIDENCFYVDTEYDAFALKYIDTVICLSYPVYCYLEGQPNQSMNLTNIIKRRDQKERVIKRIIEFYETNKNMLSHPKKNYILRIIQSLLTVQYSLYLRLNPNVAKRDCTSFDNWLYLKNDPDILHFNTQKIDFFFKLNRQTRYVFFKTTLYLGHYFGFIKQIK